MPNADFFTDKVIQKATLEMTQIDVLNSSTLKGNLFRSYRIVYQIFIQHNKPRIVEINKWLIRFTLSFTHIFVRKSVA